MLQGCKRPFRDSPCTRGMACGHSGGSPEPQKFVHATHASLLLWASQIHTHAHKSAEFAVHRPCTHSNAVCCVHTCFSCLRVPLASGRPVGLGYLHTDACQPACSYVSQCAVHSQCVSPGGGLLAPHPPCAHAAATPVHKSESAGDECATRHTSCTLARYLPPSAAYI